MYAYLNNFFINLAAGLLFLLFVIFFQFRNTNLSVIYLKDIKFTANNRLEDNKYILNSINIDARGINIDLSKDSPVYVPSSDLSLYPISYEVGGNEIYIYLENNIFLKFSIDTQNNFKIESNLSRDLRFNYKIDNNFEITIDNSTVIKGKDHNAEILLGQNVKIDKKEISISPGGFFQIGNIAKIELEVPQEVITETSRKIISKGPLDYEKIRAIDTGILNSEINSFRAKAYDYWSNSGFNSGTGWLKNGSYLFDENILVYLLAEALSRKTYEAISLRLDSLLKENDSKLTYLSMNYYSDENKINRFLSYLTRNKTFISSLEQDKLLDYLKEDPKLFEKSFIAENSLKFNEIISILKNPAKTLNTDFNVQQVYNLISNYLSFFLVNSDNLVIESFKDNISTLLSKIFKITDDGNLHVLDDNDNFDPIYTLKIAGLLSKIETIIEDDLILKFAQNAIYVALTSSGLNKSNYDLYYEDIVSNDYLPKFILNTKFGLGKWVYLAAKVENPSFNSSIYSLDFNFEFNSASYFFFNGIKVPSLVKFREIEWFTDPQFYIYSDGWKYYPSSQTLILKVSHKKNGNENITLRFDPLVSSETPEGAN